MQNNHQMDLKRLILSAFFMAVGLVLPFITGQIPEIGKALSPMHIPILLCGFICGAPYGAIVGVITPLLRSVLFGMPALFPQAVGMSFELCIYGLISGILYSRFKKKNLIAIYVTLIISMLCGRIVWGLVSIVLYGIAGNSFTVSLFLAGGFINAVPGIILHLILIPAVMAALERTGLLRTLEAGKANG